MHTEYLSFFCVVVLLDSEEYCTTVCVQKTTYCFLECFYMGFIERIEIVLVLQYQILRLFDNLPIIEKWSTTKRHLLLTLKFRLLLNHLLLTVPLLCPTFKLPIILLINLISLILKILLIIQFQCIQLPIQTTCQNSIQF